MPRATTFAERSLFSLLYRLLSILRWILPAFAWRITLYFRRLMGRPPFSTPFHDEEAGFHIAEHNLRACIEYRNLPSGARRRVVCAGFRNFREPWARDFGFAAFGLMALKEHEVVKEGLLNFIETQRTNGQFALKLHGTHVVDRFFHSVLGKHQPSEATLRPKFRTAHQTTSLDGNLLLVIAWAHYVLEMGDREFARRYLDNFRAALGFTEGWAQGGLLRQAPYSDWADSIGRRGFILYTNVLYWRAAEQLERVEQMLGEPHRGTPSESIKRAIIERYWNEDGYLNTAPGWPLLNSDGNLLAVAWGLLDSERANQVLDTLESRNMSHPVPTRVTDGPYPLYMIGPEVALAGIPNYHTSCSWMWLGGWHAVALVEAGRFHEAELLVARMAQVIELDQVVVEVHSPEGRPLRTWFYAAEAPLSWNASMFVYAHHRTHQPVACSSKKG